MSSFDSLSGGSDGSSSSNEQARQRPLFAIKHKDNKEVLQWLTSTYSTQLSRNQARYTQIENFFRLYKGADSRKKVHTPRDYYREQAQNKSNNNQYGNLAVNLVFDITETQIARLTRFKPAVQITPRHDEYEDKVAATITKKILDAIWEEQDIDKKRTRLNRRSRIAGEDFLKITWDQNCGKVLPAVKEALSKGEQVALLDENGEPVVNELGEIVEIKEKDALIGDIKYELKSARETILEPRDKYEDVDWVIFVSRMDVDKLKKDYPKKADKIKINDGLDNRSSDTEQQESLYQNNETLVLELFHRKTTYLPEGKHIIATMDTVLKNGDLPYNHGRLPVVRLTDIDDEEEGGLHGISYLVNIASLQEQLNNLTTLQLQNIASVAYAKWFMPKGACDIKSLGNGNTVVQYRGPVPPQMVQPDPFPQSVFGFRDLLKEEMNQIGGGTPQDRGEPPKGVTAAVALQFLDEQAQERMNTYVQKNNQALIEIAKLTLKTAGQYYNNEDGRLEDILGSSNADLAKQFDMNRLAQEFAINVENSSALPQTRAARTQTILDLSERYPDLFSNQQIINILELGNLDKFNDASTAALKAASAENEQMKQGIEVAEPEEYEDSLMHWREHAAEMQTRAFKDTPPQIKQLFLDHMIATEWLMVQQAKENPSFFNELLTMKMFPMVYTLTPEEKSLFFPQANPPALPPAAPQMDGSAGMPEEPQADEPLPLDTPALPAPDSMTPSS